MTNSVTFSEVAWHHPQQKGLSLCPYPQAGPCPVPAALECPWLGLGMQGQAAVWMMGIGAGMHVWGSAC